LKIQGRCRNCGRDFPIDLLFEDPRRAGRCSFCGVPMDQQYGPLLVTSLEQLERAGTFMVSTLKRVESFGPNLEIDEESILGPIREAIGKRQEASARRKATEEAAARGAAAAS
jgi:hypothetical protein